MTKGDKIQFILGNCHYDMRKEQRNDWSGSLYYPYFDGSPMPIKAEIIDHDSASSNDTVGKFEQTIDIAANTGKELTFNWSSGSGEASRLHIKIEKLSAEETARTFKEIESNRKQ